MTDPRISTALQHLPLDDPSPNRLVWSVVSPDPSGRVQLPAEVVDLLGAGPRHASVVDGVLVLGRVEGPVVTSASTSGPPLPTRLAPTTGPRGRSPTRRDGVVVVADVAVLDAVGERLLRAVGAMNARRPAGHRHPRRSPRPRCRSRRPRRRRRPGRTCRPSPNGSPRSTGPSPRRRPAPTAPTGTSRPAYSATAGCPSSPPSISRPSSGPPGIGPAPATLGQRPVGRGDLRRRPPSPLRSSGRCQPPHHRPRRSARQTPPRPQPPTAPSTTTRPPTSRTPSASPAETPTSTSCSSASTSKPVLAAKAPSAFASGMSTLDAPPCGSGRSMATSGATRLPVARRRPRPTPPPANNRRWEPDGSVPRPHRVADHRPSLRHALRPCPLSAAVGRPHTSIGARAPPHRYHQRRPARRVRRRPDLRRAHAADGHRPVHPRHPRRGRGSRRGAHRRAPPAGSRWCSASSVLPDVEATLTCSGGRRGGPIGRGFCTPRPMRFSAQNAGSVLRHAGMRALVLAEVAAPPPEPEGAEPDVRWESCPEPRLRTSYDPNMARSGSLEASFQVHVVAADRP